MVRSESEVNSVMIPRFTLLEAQNKSPKSFLGTHISMCASCRIKEKAEPLILSGAIFIFLTFFQ